MARWRQSCETWVALFVLCAVFAGEGDHASAADRTAGLASASADLPQRQITVTGYASHDPLFAADSQTLDPITIARTAQRGYLSRMCEPWGLTAAFKPTIRFFFDDRILPWCELKHHGVDGFDNNSRNLGAWSLLREMQVQSGPADDVERGQLAYLLSITDPEGGLPYNPDALPRHCALGHGELARNVMLYYEQSHDSAMRAWAEKMLATLRRYAFTRDITGVGRVAEYHQGGGGGQMGFVVGDPPVASDRDVTLGGWQHLNVGWGIGAFAKWHELTGDAEALEFSVALANRLCTSADSTGNDGSLQPDGSFGGTESGSLHMHGHTHSLPGLVALGKQLIAAGRRDEGIRFIRQAQRTFNWLYDSSRNPDAGSMTGWLPEFLCVKSGNGRNGDCEGCTIGDVVQTAAALAQASRLDVELADLDSYFDVAEQIYRSQVAASIFHPTPEYQRLLRDCLEKRVAKDLHAASAAQRATEVDRRFATSLASADRMDGRLLGLCGFGDWVNNLPSSLDADLPGIDMMGCCGDAVIRASHAVWRASVTGDAECARINLPLNHDCDLVRVTSCVPHRGEVDVVVKSAQQVAIRLPADTPRDQVKTFVDRRSVAPTFEGNYAVFKNLAPDQLVTVTFSLRLATVEETIHTTSQIKFRETWRGAAIIDIDPPGRWLPNYHRPELAVSELPK